MTDARSQLIASHLVEGYGLVEASLSECSSRIDGWRLGPASTLTVIAATNDVAQAIDFVSRLTFPATRHVLLPLQNCTAMVNNSRNGSDVADHITHLAQRFEARAARVLDGPGHIWTNDGVTEVLEYEAHLLQLHAASGALLRTVACMNDGGRWTFHTDGTPHPIEQAFDYSARRKKDRFTSECLRRLLGAFGLPCLDVAHLLAAPQYLLIREDYTSPEWADRIEARGCTFEQANDSAHGYYQRGLGWVEQMETHAESVIADFERAMRLNPSYEPLVTPHLMRAREVLARRRP